MSNIFLVFYIYYYYSWR